MGILWAALLDSQLILAIVGGQITVTTQHNVGTRFDIELPTNHSNWMKSL